MKQSFLWFVVGMISLLTVDALVGNAQVTHNKKNLFLGIDSIKSKDAGGIEVRVTLSGSSGVCLNGSRFMLSGLLRGVVFYDQQGRVWQIAPSRMVVQLPPLKDDLSIRLDPTATVTVTLDTSLELSHGRTPESWPMTLSYIAVSRHYQVAVCDTVSTEWADVYGRGEVKLQQ